MWRWTWPPKRLKIRMSAIIASCIRYARKSALHVFVSMVKCIPFSREEISVLQRTLTVESYVSKGDDSLEAFTKNATTIDCSTTAQET